MNAPKQIRPELVARVEELKATDEDALVTLRGLYRFYFDSKSTATTDEKAYLLGEGFGFSVRHVPYTQDRVIFDKESERFYTQANHN